MSSSFEINGENVWNPASEVGFPYARMAEIAVPGASDEPRRGR
ncbi:hypothetical protein [Kribbella sp. DT2]